jgi:four helix bundle protein
MDGEMRLRSYRDLRVWQEAIKLVEIIYGICKSMPQEERYGLCSQMQRASVSVPANVAEGYERDHRKEYLHHLSISRGSLAELETHLIIAERLGFLTRKKAVEGWNQSQLVGRILRGLIDSLKGRGKKASHLLAPSPEPLDPEAKTAKTRSRTPTSAGQQKE